MKKVPLITLLFLAALSLVAVAETANIQTYDQLIAAIRTARKASVTRVEAAVRVEKVRACWETGKLIDEHVLLHKERADYADQTLFRLAKDLGTSETELRYTLKFARTYKIPPTSEELSWSDYRELLGINDSVKREAVARQAAKENWSTDRLREEVRRVNAESNVGARSPRPPVDEAGPQMQDGETPPLRATPGKIGTYKIVKATVGPETGKTVIDLGFSNYYKTSKDLQVKDGGIVEAISAVPGAGSAPSDKIRLSKRTYEDLYTYRAYVVRVLDGDTVKVVVDLGFGVRSVQTLRLRGIDCPELISAEGKEAKAFLEKLLQGTGGRVQSAGDRAQGAGARVQETGANDRKASANASRLNPEPYPLNPAFILVRTVRSDKYDRYLADLFVNGTYVNQSLLDKGLAVKMDE